jgi:hypothetical protein
MKPGQGNGNFIGDLHTGVSDEEMRNRYKRGDYGKMRPDYVEGWRKLAGRIGKETI